MKANDFKEPYIRIASFTYNYNSVEEIERYALLIEEHFQSLFGSEIEYTRKNGPSEPRLVLTDKKKKLIISIDSATLAHDFSSLKDMVKALSVYKKNTETVFKYLKSNDKTFKILNFKSQISINYPLKDMDSPIAKYVYDKYISLEHLDEKISRIALMIEDTIDNMKIQYHVYQYESRSYTNPEIIKKKHYQEIHIDTENSTLVERGILINIIVNNHLKLKSSDVENYFESILNKIITESKNWPKKIFLGQE
ncbi:hypothetical protein MHK_006808 [Candidatus Magnetomorum sp. HK-1]|nr:hypothetical protein MHK_006808 [Candidatus Magnetomorum sp. HK-1]